MAKNRSGWQKGFFDISFYNPASPAALSHAVRETDFVCSVLKLKKGASLLDVACGPGRHAVRFAKKGLNVTGLDFSAQYLAEAEKAARTARVCPRFVRGDMRALPFRAEFDAAVCLFTSFGYFGERDNLKTLKSISRALKPGGLFLIDVIDREWFEINYADRRWDRLEDGSYMLYEDEYHSGRRAVFSSWTVIRPGHRPVTRSFYLRMYSLKELKALLLSAGMKPLSSWSGFNKNKAGNRLVVLAGKI